ncbi:unnamed protein product [Fraxinus pennsylvanica]|uniref:Bulb-type lectin domain-containing protein n=1 Tax=Fraxinus pennsylvanica TaxID=56036 RepID=A0AAD2E2C2_9LAMI|nr:unnamed protein product [Fraxinus pennsylvanica]
MQMLRAVSIIMTIFLLIFYYSVSHVSSVGTLKQRDRLNSSAYLVSANGVFTLGFYSLENTNNSYLGVWFTKNIYGPIWLGNRDKPITDNSGVLTISNARKLVINSSRGDPIELYANENGMNITATLLNSGNFVVKEMDINAGAFTLEWDPSRHRLIVRRREVAYWTSGELKDYIDEDRPDLKLKKFENIGDGYDPYNFIYNFVNVTNDDEDYMSYSLEIDPVLTPEKLKNSGWKLDSEGSIIDHNGVRIISDVSRCYGYNTREGCEFWEKPKCRNHRETFSLRSGHFLPITDSYAVYDDNSSLTKSDCRGNCWNDCECVGYTAGSKSGCVYWKGKYSTFELSLDHSEVDKYVLIPEPANKGKKKMIWIIIAVVITVVLLLLGSSWFIMRKTKQGKMEEELEKMITLEEYTDNDELDYDGRKGHDLRLFTYSSILAATNSFSSKNKLGFSSVSNCDRIKDVN